MALHWIGKQLPSEYRFAHEYCFALHDELATFVQRIERERLTSVELKLRAEHSLDQVVHLGGEELSDWLEANAYSEIVGQMVFRACVHALLGDSCHYLYEALRCSEKAKLTVCFTLLRKPLRENLLYLEYLLYNPNKFLRAFWDHGPQHVAVETLLARGKGPTIIAGAMGQTIHKGLFDPHFLFQLRYDPTQPYSYDPLWTKATHLVTTKKSAATESKNLNFVFSDSEAHADQWDHLYATLPVLLFHMVDVVTSLLLLMGADDPTTPDLVLRRDLGLVLWSRDPARVDVRKGDRRRAPMALECPGCRRPIPWVWARYRAAFEGRGLTCTRCRRRWPLTAFLTAA
jgi:hypothetical protein